MATSDTMRGVLQKTLNKYGEPVLLKFYATTAVSGTDYDDSNTLTQSGTSLWAQAYIQSLASRQNSEDHVLVQQGKILFDDSKIYFNGSIFTNGSLTIKIGVGSPTPTTWYTTLPEGTDSNQINGVDIYKKFYCRVLPNGSLFGQ